MGDDPVVAGGYARGELRPFKVSLLRGRTEAEGAKHDDSEIVNVEQAANWDGPDGEYWAAHQARFDGSIGPHHRQLMAAAAIAPGERVLDIAAATGSPAATPPGRPGRRVGPRCRPVGADAGAGRAAGQGRGLGNIRFEQADAQVHTFEPGAFDVVISRFGVMFFADPPAAFANIASAVRSGGRLAMLVWQPLAANEWMTAMRGALAVGRDLPVPPPGVPSPFGLPKGLRHRRADGSRFTDVAFEDSEQPSGSAPTPTTPTGSWPASSPPHAAGRLDEATKAQALDNLRATAAAHETADGVVFGSAAWVVTARKP